MKEEIQELKKTFLKMAEDLRLKLGAYSVKIQIETDCDHENICDIHLNIG